MNRTIQTTRTTIIRRWLRERLPRQAVTVAIRPVVRVTVIFQARQARTTLTTVRQSWARTYIKPYSHTYKILSLTWNKRSAHVSVTHAESACKNAKRITILYAPFHQLNGWVRWAFGPRERWPNYRCPRSLCHLGWPLHWSVSLVALVRFIAFRLSCLHRVDILATPRSHLHLFMSIACVLV